MKRIFYLAALSLFILLPVSAQGLRHSVCIVQPELAEADKSLMADYALYMARAGMRSASRALTAYKSDGTYGSGVVVEQDGKKYVLTNLHVVGYAEKATIVFQLHERTVRYEHCAVVNIGETDLAAIELPTDCEMIALPIYRGEIEEDISIVAAGFPELANKPSWQLTRGSISNARVDVGHREHATRIIQHTASIDPGSSGGPLLLKNSDGKYEILGINTWKAFYREGVGLAIGKEDVQTFMSTMLISKTAASQEVKPLRAISGENWLYIFRQLPDSVQKDLRETDWHLPFDPALRTLAVRDSLVANKGKGKSVAQYDASAPHVVTDLDNSNHFYLIYDNYMGMNQVAGIQLGHDWLGFVTTGLQVTALIAEAVNSGTQAVNAGPMFGVYLGAQVPIQIGRYVLAPRVTQSASAGPFFNGNKFNTKVAIATDTRVGLDWRIPNGSSEFVIGLHYNLDLLWNSATLVIPPHKTTSGSLNLNQYIQHGIGVNVGFAW